MLVLAHRTPNEGYFYSVSPQEGTLKKAVNVKKIMNGDTVVEIKLLVLGTDDQLVIKDFQEQLDFWNARYEEWISSKKP